MKNTLSNIRKPSKNKFVIVTIVLVASLLSSSLYINIIRASGNASISFNTASSSYAVGSDFNVSVIVNAASNPVNAVQVNLTYDASKLRLNSISSPTSPYTTQFSINTPSGSIQVVRSTSPGTNTTGSSTFMNISFKALVAGPANLRVASGSEITESVGFSEVWNGATTNANISITALPTPAPTPVPAPTTPVSPVTPVTPNPTTPTSPTTTNQPPADSNQNQATPNPTPPPSNPPAKEIIEESPTAESDFRKATIRLRTKIPVRAKIIYGVNGQLSFSTPESELTQSPVIALDPKLIDAGTTYTFRVILTDEAGNITETQTETFKSKGYTLQLVYRDKNDQPLKQVKITLKSEPQEGITNDEGVVTFTDVELGEHTATAEIDGQEYPQTLSVVDNVVFDESGAATSAIQVAALTVDTESSQLPRILAITIPSLLLMVVGVSIIIKKGVFTKKERSTMVVPANSAFNSQNSNSFMKPQSHQDNNGSDIDPRLKPEPPRVESVIEPDKRD